MPTPPLRQQLGQHHLRSGHLCRPLIDFLRPAAARVVEIGPGGGVLSAELLAAGAARVVACELDLAWTFELRRRLPSPRLAPVALDATTLAWQRLPAPTLVAGNLPFAVATRILRALLPHGERVPRAAFLVQKEVAERLVAGPGESAYGALSVEVAAYAAARRLATVRPGSFRPPPAVSAAFVGLTLRAPPLPAAEMPAFLGLVRDAFAQRRKTVRNALAAAWGRQASERTLAAAGVDAGARAQQLALGDFLALHRARRRW